MEYHHKQELIILQDCPPTSYIIKVIDCYRWVFEDINNLKNFQSQAHKNPKCLNDKSDIEKCEYYALSFHESDILSEKHYNLLIKRFKNISKNIGTHLSKGSLCKDDGIGSNVDKLSHFNFHFIKGANFCSKFTIIKTL